MKKVLIIHGRLAWKKNKIFEKEMYRLSYEYFYDLARNRGLEIYRASYLWYDFKKKRFSYAWTYKDKKWQRVYNIKPDLVWDKTRPRMEIHYFKERLERDCLIVNDPEFTLLANNKFFTSLLFPNYFKRYYKVFDYQNLKVVSSLIKGAMIVLKPLHGSGGENISIIKKNQLRKISFDRPMIAQEFIDSSRGIKNVVKGIHDLRLVFVNNKLIYSYIRVPAKGSLLANLAQGGSMFIVEKRNLPKKVLPIIKNVLEVFRFYDPKIFTIDLIFDKKQVPWIVELNTMPGMYFSPDQKKWMDKFYLELINTFKKSADKRA